jgi:DNA (cytosine-5)-methyltransferase 1
MKNTESYSTEISKCLNAKGGAMRMDAESETLITTGVDMYNLAETGQVAHTVRSQLGGGQGHPAPHVVTPFDTTQVTSKVNQSNPKPGDPCHPLAAGAHAPAITITTPSPIGFMWQAGQGGLL